MNIVVINGTEVKGCTWRIKETFLSALREGNEIIEFVLPKDLPQFCCGCKTCFFQEEAKCPHADAVMPIWNAILKADTIVFAYPVYALRAPAAVKSLLDHLCVHWMVHRPDRRMFQKKAVILTQGIGAFNGAAQKDVKTSLTWMGVSDIKTLGFGLMEGVIWENLSKQRKQTIERKTRAVAEKTLKAKPGHMRPNVRVLFWICKQLHKKTLRNETIPSKDNQHYIDHGWIQART